MPLQYKQDNDTAITILFRHIFVLFLKTRDITTFFLSIIITSYSAHIFIQNSNILNNSKTPYYKGVLNVSNYKKSTVTFSL